MSTASAWSRFRTWRRSRPFWGGLFLLVAALELFLSANLTIKDLQVHIGQEGYLSYLLPAILILCGVLSWASPAQRLFYGILGLLTALYSFLGLNLGGFLLGMIIGIVGGALVVSWGPPRVKRGTATDGEPEEGEPEEGEPEDAEALDGDLEDVEPGAETAGPVVRHDPNATAILPGFADQHEPDDHHEQGLDDRDREPEPRPPGGAGGVHRKLMVITFVPLALTAAMLLAGSHTPARADTDCPDGLPSRTATAGSPDSAAKQAAAKRIAKAAAAKKAPVEKAPVGKAPVTKAPAKKTGQLPAPGTTTTPAPAETATGTDGTGNPLVDGWNDFVDGVGKVFGVGGDESPSPSASAEPSPGPTTAPAPTPSRTPGAIPSVTATPAAPTGPAGSGSPSPTPSLSDVPCLGPRVLGKKAGADGEPAVAIKGGLLEGHSLNMYNSTYDGTVDLQTANGPLKALKFSMSKAVTEPFSLTITEAGGRHTVITSKKLTIADTVKFYTPNFQGRLFGVFPVTFTPDSPPPLTLPWLWFTDVKINLAFVSCGTLTAAPLGVTES